MGEQWWRQPSIRVVLAVSFISILGFGAQRAVLPWHMREMGIRPELGGLFLSLYGISRAVMNILGGYLTDSFRRKRNYLAGILLYGILGYGLLAFSTHGVNIAISRVVMGLGISWATTAAMAILTDYSTLSNRGTLFGAQKGFFWVAITLSGYFSMILYPSLGFRGIMLFSVLASLAALFLVVLKLETFTPVERSAGGAAKTGSMTLAGCWRFCGGDRRYIVLNIVGFMTKVLEDGVVLFLFPFFLARDQLAVALSVTVFTAAFAVFQPLGAGVSDKFGRRQVIIFGCCLTSLGLLPLAFSPGTLGMVAAASAMGIGVGAISPTAEAAAGDLAPLELKGTAIGYWRFFRDMGSFAGPLLLPVLIIGGGVILTTSLLIATLMVGALGIGLFMSRQNEEG